MSDYHVIMFGVMILSHVLCGMCNTVSPDAIHDHVKTKIEAQETKRLHYAAPEFAMEGGVKTSSDIYAFGICALEASIMYMYVQ